MSTKETPLPSVTFTVSVTFSEPQASIEVSPASIDFGRWTTTAPISKTVSITNRGQGQKILTISSITVPNWVTIDKTSATIGTNQTEVFTITLKSDLAAGSFTGTLVFANDSPTPTASVGLSATVVALPGKFTYDSDTTVTVPRGITKATITLVGGGGGAGAGDYGGFGEGNNGTPGKTLTGDITVSPGDTLVFNIGTGGDGGIASRNNKTQRIFGGENSYIGSGGEAGLLTVSGQGGGGGAATVVRKNGSVIAIAAGGGGAGGSGSNSPGQVRKTMAYIGGNNGAQGASVGDAGSGGGGGGGLQGGAGGTAPGGDNGAFQGSQGKSQIPSGWTESNADNGAKAVKDTATKQPQPSGGNGIATIEFKEN